jgi:3'(2'), 5'-bisphosphate nucleotidase
VIYERELEVAERAARAAGEILRAHYARATVQIDTKADASPVTQADREANEAILSVLRAAFPDDAILSEETPDNAARLSARRVWIIDPLDGTRDFIARTGEFAVHVGFAVDGVATVGAVYRPTLDAMYSAVEGGEATCTTAAVRHVLRVSSEAARDKLRIGTSRMNPSSLLSRVVAETGIAAQTVAMGASTKHMAVAAGDIDAVIALGSEHEWDTCAPEVVVRAAGGAFTDGDGQRFRYNQRDTMHYRGSLATNRACHAELVELVRPYLATGPR